MTANVVLQHCGVIDPNEIDTFIERGGFQGLQKAWAMGPDAVIAEIRASKLRGRGGAGFPCAAKWESARSTTADKKYVICNADEGEVGTFKDRHLMAGDPFSLIEGLGIAAWAIGAKTAYIYLRQEYHYLLAGLERSVQQAANRGLTGDVAIKVIEGAGAYICGEESALMNSIEGLRGEARFRPPFPPQSGLFGRPTIIHNVETLMNIPRIISNGAAWFAGLGTPQSSGTKVFSVSGDVERPGVYEFVMGTPLTELLAWAGAGEIKMVQVGGATGRILPGSLLETPLSFETVLGSGAITVFDTTRDVIDILHRSMQFLNEESCGQCAPCREGSEAMVAIYARLAAGDGAAEDIVTLERLAALMRESSLCGLGQAAAIPVTDSLTYFRSDYETRIRQSLWLKTLHC